MRNIVWNAEGGLFGHAVIAYRETSYPMGLPFYTDGSRDESELGKVRAYWHMPLSGGSVANCYVKSIKPKIGARIGHADF